MYIIKDIVLLQFSTICTDILTGILSFYIIETLKKKLSILFYYIYLFYLFIYMLNLFSKNWELHLICNPDMFIIINTYTHTNKHN